MIYFKKRGYRIFESLVKKILRIQKKSNNENFQKMIRSAVFNSELKKNKLLFSNGSSIQYLMQSSDWVSKKLYIDQSFDDKILKKAISQGGSSIKDFSTEDGKKGSYQKHFKVYGRNGKKCSNVDCNKNIIRIVI